ncbi:MAG: pyrimidine 5'-nucleotidase [Desulfuromonas sp.]|nr:pyrimidine 5'-nucleotidase [Desulfuromonas sp.]
MDVIFFDLDNTLYSADRALFDLIDVRINRYMHEVVGIDADRVDGLRRDYWQRYGVTLQGLIQEHDADAEHYLDYVHDIDVSSRLSANPELRERLLQLPQRKFVFTNGSDCHARRVLDCLDISDCFEQIFDIRVSGDYIPKPHHAPYQAVLKAAAVRAEQSIMVEDSLPNLQTAAELGMRTIFVGDHCDDPCVDAVVGRVEQVTGVVQQWMSAAN